MPAPRADLRASLLDRLVDLHPHARRERAALRTQTPAALVESVRRDLEWLLSTRCGVPAALVRTRGRSVHDYGLHDVAARTPRSHEDRRAVAQAVEEAVAAFEPRLRHVRVAVDEAPGAPASLWITIDAILAADALHEPVSFPFIVFR